MTEKLSECQCGHSKATHKFQNMCNVQGCGCWLFKPCTIASKPDERLLTSKEYINSIRVGFGFPHYDDIKQVLQAQDANTYPLAFEAGKKAQEYVLTQVREFYEKTCGTFHHEIREFLSQNGVYIDFAATNTEVIIAFKEVQEKLKAQKEADQQEIAELEAANQRQSDSLEMRVDTEKDHEQALSEAKKQGMRELVDWVLHEVVHTGTGDELRLSNSRWQMKLKELGL